MSSISKYDDVIDSRDVIARIQELTQSIESASGREADDYPTTADWLASAQTCADVDPEEVQELQTLQSLADEAESSPDWEYGETLIRDSYFRDYAQELAEDCGMIPPDLRWPVSCIDWDQAARELQMDYFSVDFDGITYWIRG